MASGASERAAIVGATLGEGPIWIERDKALWFVDIKQLKVHRFDPATGGVRSWDAPAQIGWIVPEAGAAFIVGLQTGLARFDPADGGFTPIASVEPDRPRNRLNDAVTDSAGRIWFGSMDDSESARTGRYYVAGADGIADTGLPPFPITNGPAISPDGGTLYHTDTLGRAIHAVEIRDGQVVGEPRLFAAIEDGAGHPDGPSVDAEGCVWTGMFGGWSARRYSPQGRLIETVRFPVANITKVAFGGPDLRTAYATTARLHLDAAALESQTMAGDLFAFAVDTPGLPVNEARLAR